MGWTNSFFLESLIVVSLLLLLFVIEKQFVVCAQFSFSSCPASGEIVLSGVNLNASTNSISLVNLVDCNVTIHNASASNPITQFNVQNIRGNSHLTLRDVTTTNIAFSGSNHFQSITLDNLEYYFSVLQTTWLYVTGSDFLVNQLAITNCDMKLYSSMMTSVSLISLHNSVTSLVHINNTLIENNKVRLLPNAQAKICHVHLIDLFESVSDVELVSVVLRSNLVDVPILDCMGARMGASISLASLRVRKPAASTAPRAGVSSSLRVENNNITIGSIVDKSTSSTSYVREIAANFVIVEATVVLLPQTLTLQDNYFSVTSIAILRSGNSFPGYDEPRSIHARLFYAENVPSATSAGREPDTDSYIQISSAASTAASSPAFVSWNVINNVAKFEFRQALIRPGFVARSALFEINCSRVSSFRSGEVSNNSENNTNNSKIEHLPHAYFVGNSFRYSMVNMDAQIGTPVDNRLHFLHDFVVFRRMLLSNLNVTNNIHYAYFSQSIALNARQILPVHRFVMLENTTIDHARIKRPSYSVPPEGASQKQAPAPRFVVDDNTDSFSIDTPLSSGYFDLYSTFVYADCLRQPSEKPLVPTSTSTNLASILIRNNRFSTTRARIFSKASATESHISFNVSLLTVKFNPLVSLNGKVGYLGFSLDFVQVSNNVLTAFTPMSQIEFNVNVSVICFAAPIEYYGPDFIFTHNSLTMNLQNQTETALAEAASARDDQVYIDGLVMLHTFTTPYRYSIISPTSPSYNTVHNQNLTVTISNNSVSYLNALNGEEYGSRSDGSDYYHRATYVHLSRLRFPYHTSTARSQIFNYVMENNYVEVSTYREDYKASLLTNRRILARLGIIAGLVYHYFNDKLRNINIVANNRVTVTTMDALCWVGFATYVEGQLGNDTVVSGNELTVRATRGTSYGFGCPHEIYLRLPQYYGSVEADANVVAFLYSDYSRLSSDVEQPGFEEALNSLQVVNNRVDVQWDTPLSSANQLGGAAPHATVYFSRFTVRPGRSEAYSQLFSISRNSLEIRTPGGGCPSAYFLRVDPAQDNPPSTFQILRPAKMSLEGNTFSSLVDGSICSLSKYRPGAVIRTHSFVSFRAKWKSSAAGWYEPPDLGVNAIVDVISVERNSVSWTMSGYNEQYSISLVSLQNVSTTTRREALTGWNPISSPIAAAEANDFVLDIHANTIDLQLQVSTQATGGVIFLHVDGYCSRSFNISRNAMTATGRWNRTTIDSIDFVKLVSMRINNIFTSGGSQTFYDPYQAQLGFLSVSNNRVQTGGTGIVEFSLVSTFGYFNVSISCAISSNVVHAGFLVEALDPIGLKIVDPVARRVSVLFRSVLSLARIHTVSQDYIQHNSMQVIGGPFLIHKNNFTRMFSQLFEINRDYQQVIVPDGVVSVHSLVAENGVTVTHNVFVVVADSVTGFFFGITPRIPSFNFTSNSFDFSSLTRPTFVSDLAVDVGQKQSIYNAFVTYSKRNYTGVGGEFSDAAFSLASYTIANNYLNTFTDNSVHVNSTATLASIAGCGDGVTKSLDVRGNALHSKGLYTEVNLINQTLVRVTPFCSCSGDAFTVQEARRQILSGIYLTDLFVVSKNSISQENVNFAGGRVDTETFPIAQDTHVKVHLVVFENARTQLHPAVNISGNLLALGWAAARYVEADLLRISVGGSQFASTLQFRRNRFRGSWLGQSGASFSLLSLTGWDLISSGAVPGATLSFLAGLVVQSNRWELFDQQRASEAPTGKRPGTDVGPYSGGILSLPLEPSLTIATLAEVNFSFNSLAHNFQRGSSSIYFLTPNSVSAVAEYLNSPTKRYPLTVTDSVDATFTCNDKFFGNNVPARMKLYRNIRTTTLPCPPRTKTRSISVTLVPPTATQVATETDGNFTQSTSLSLSHSFAETRSAELSTSQSLRSTPSRSPVDTNTDEPTQTARETRSSDVSQSKSEPTPSKGSPSFGTPSSSQRVTETFQKNSRTTEATASKSHSLSHSASVTATFYVPPQKTTLQFVNEVFQDISVAASILAFPGATVAFGIGRQQSMENLLDGAASGTCGLELIKEEPIAWSESPLQLSIDAAGRFRYVVGTVVGNVVLTLGLNVVFFVVGVIYHSFVGQLSTVPLLAVAIRAQVPFIFIVFVAVLFGATLEKGISLFFDPYVPHEYLVLVGCLGTVYLFYIGWFLRMTLMNKEVWSSVVFEYASDDVNPASKVDEKRRKSEADDEKKKKTKDRARDEAKLRKATKQEQAKTKRLASLDLAQLLKLDSSDDEDIPPPAGATTVFIDVDADEDDDDHHDGQEDDEDDGRDAGDFDTTTTSATTAATTTSEIEKVKLADGDGVGGGSCDNADDDFDQLVQAYVAEKTSASASARQPNEQVHRHLTWCWLHVRRWIAWWLEDLGSWRYAKPSTRDQRLLFHFALPVIEGYISTAPRFFVFELALQVWLVGAIVAGQLLNADPDRSCKAQGMVSVLGIGAFLGILLWLKPIQPRIQYYATIVCVALQLAITLLATIVQSGTPWITHLFLLLFIANTILMIVCFIQFVSRIGQSIARGRLILRSPVDGNGDSPDTASRLPKRDSRRVAMKDVLDRPLFQGVAKDPPKKHFAPRPESTDAKLLKLLNGRGESGNSQNISSSTVVANSSHQALSNTSENEVQELAPLRRSDHGDSSSRENNAPPSSTKSQGRKKIPTTFDEIDNELRRAHREAQESSANLRRFAVDATGEIGALKQEQEAKALSDLVRVEKLRREIEKIADV